MKVFSFFLLLAVSIASCKNQSNPGVQADQVTQSAVRLPQDFQDFYEKFHRDSLFQLEHIVWPLQGDTSEQLDSTHFEKKDTYWQREKWHMQRVDYDPNDYQRDVQTLGDVLIIERIRAVSANYGLERRFAKQPDGQWALIYYSDMQELGKK